MVVETIWIVLILVAVGSIGTICCLPCLIIFVILAVVCFPCIPIWVIVCCPVWLWLALLIIGAVFLSRDGKDAEVDDTLD